MRRNEAMVRGRIMDVCRSMAPPDMVLGWRCLNGEDGTAANGSSEKMSLPSLFWLVALMWLIVRFGAPVTVGVAEPPV